MKKYYYTWKNLNHYKNKVFNTNDDDEFGFYDASTHMVICIKMVYQLGIVLNGL